MPEGNKVPTRNRTVHCTKVGNFFVPPMRHRVSDAVISDARLFATTKDRAVADCVRLPLMALNKSLIESVALL